MPAIAVGRTVTHSPVFQNELTGAGDWPRCRNVNLRAWRVASMGVFMCSITVSALGHGRSSRKAGMLLLYKSDFTAD